MNENFAEMQLQNLWTNLVQSTYSFAAAQQQLCSPRARPLIHSETQKLTCLPQPADEVEMAIRRTQHLELSSRLSSIQHADFAARMYPNVSTEILAAVEEYLSAPYPTTETIPADSVARRSALMSTIAGHCDAEVSARLRRR